MNKLTTIAALLLVCACGEEAVRPAAARGAAIVPVRHTEDLRVVAADELTRAYAGSPLSAPWNVQAKAIGPDCGLLLVQLNVIMQDSLIEALHYGSGAYDMIEGGVQRFQRDRSFRGVAYRDASGRVWAYGAASPSEVETLSPCH